MTDITHQALARELSDGIWSGRYPVGTLLPTENELCAQYAMSRYSVRKALAELAEQGLITRKKNAGTRVAAARPVSRFTQAIATIEELAQFGARHVRSVQSVRKVIADLELARELGCDGGTEWLKISSLRMDPSGVAWPICATDVYVDAALADVGRLARKHPQALISSLIEQRYGRAIARVRQDIEAVSLPPDLAQPLQADAGSPALKITRKYIDNEDRVFEISRTIHPAKRFTFSMELTRSKA